MPRPPKNPAVRQRRNRASTAASLPPANSSRRVPGLPAKKKPGWHARTREWWRDVWRSPMAAKFLQADLHALYRLAQLIDGFWHGDLDLAGEIRLQEQRFGLTPLDRWRLQWEIHENPKPAPEAQRALEPAPPPPITGPDPRKVLSMVPGKRG